MTPPDAGAEPPAVAAPLYALPPDAFVAARDALARRLAEARDPAAAFVRKLRRPVGLAWVLNHLAASRAQFVAALLRAGDRLRAAQTAALRGGATGALREAEAELRDAARALRLAAAPVLERAQRRAAPPAMARLEVLLRGLATGPDDLRERFRKGLLDREPDVAAGAEAGLSGLASLAVFAPEGAPAVPRERGPSDAGGKGGLRLRARNAGPTLRLSGRSKRGSRAQRREEQARKKAAEEAEARARERARLLGEAKRALAAAEAQVEKKRAGVAAAEERLDAARAELEAAEGEARGARERVERLGEGSGGAHQPPSTLPGVDGNE